MAFWYDFELNFKTPHILTSRMVPRVLGGILEIIYHLQHDISVQLTYVILVSWLCLWCMKGNQVDPLV